MFAQKKYALSLVRLHIAPAFTSALKKVLRRAMIQTFVILFFSILALLVLVARALELRAQGSDIYGAGLRINLSEDSTKYLRFLTWHQVWFRFMENNPNTYINEAAAPTSFDIGLRRSRFLVFAQINDNFLVLTHIGVNNQTQSTGGLGAPGSAVDPNASAKKPQLFVHDAYGELRIAGGKKPTNDGLFWGFGLHSYNGLSRMSMSSTLNYMANDAPIINWAEIEASDQFARMLGTYIKGKFSGFNYTFALDMPFRFAAGNNFTNFVNLPNDSSRTTSNYAPNALTPMWKGYVSYEFWEKESRVLPFTVGTYVGTKKVFSLGVGFQHQSNAMRTRAFNIKTNQYDTSNVDFTALSADVFVDAPLRDGKDSDALTFYAAYYRLQLGKNYLRHIGIMNPATSARPTPESPNALSGAGNAYPLIGTGNAGYAEIGYVLPGRAKLLPDGAFSSMRIQPYLAATVCDYEALRQPFLLPEAGVNFYLEGHNCRLNLHYRGRPVYDQYRNYKDTRTEIIFQAQVYL
jgi:hypothetical protein